MALSPTGSSNAGLLEFAGTLDCSANPNYPAGSEGDAYVVSVAGKVGGASGKSVEVGDLVIATADNAGGTEASVGTSWTVQQGNTQLASQAEAEAGADNTKLMTPLRVAQAMATLGLGTLASQNANNVSITGGAIDGTTIGGTTKAAGSFTSITIAPANDTTGLTLTGGSITGSGTTPFASITGTWNTTGQPTALLVNITKTATGAEGKLFDFQLGGSSRIRGYEATGGDNTTLRLESSHESSTFALLRAKNNCNCVMGGDGGAVRWGLGQQIDTGLNNGLVLQFNYIVGWTSSALNNTAADTILVRDAADTLALRRTTNAQTLRLYRTYTDASNYERLALQSGAGYFEIAAETAGTGTADISVRLTPSGAGLVEFPGGTLLKTVAALTDGAAAQTGTLTNAPAAGNPTKWLPINDNGTTRYIPAW